MIKPILFNTEMVRAILDGRKTVTRRVIKDRDIINGWDCEADGTPIAYIDQATGDSYLPTAPCHYHPGDVLWVRETFFRDECTPDCAGQSDPDECPFNRVGGSCYGYKTQYIDSTGKIKWRPSIHMPREAARLFLRVKDVWVERLQDITEEQAVIEGIFLDSPDFIPTYHYDKSKCNVPGAGWNTARECFLWGVWDSTVKPSDRTVYGHFANPWVWVIEFERCEKPAGWPGEAGEVGG